MIEIHFIWYVEIVKLLLSQKSQFDLVEKMKNKNRTHASLFQSSEDGKQEFFLCGLICVRFTSPSNKTLTSQMLSIFSTVLEMIVSGHLVTSTQNICISTCRLDYTFSILSWRYFFTFWNSDNRFIKFPINLCCYEQHYSGPILYCRNGLTYKISLGEDAYGKRFQT